MTQVCTKHPLHLDKSISIEKTLMLITLVKVRSIKFTNFLILPNLTESTDVMTISNLVIIYLILIL